MRAYRIADRRFPIFDGAGAQRTGGRWNSPGTPVIYAAETFAGAVLEVLVHMGRMKLPKNRVYVEISIPDSLFLEACAEEVLGWDAADEVASRKLGDEWLSSAKSPVLLVPSLATQGVERNLLINPRHPTFSRLTTSTPRDVSWDGRLFPRNAT